MPLSVAPRRALDKAQVQRISELITDHEEPRESTVHSDRNDEAPQIDETDLWLVKYDELAQKTRSIPLSHLGCCAEGAALFSDLCMWVDVNQQYVELGLFPQWDDIARELEIDDMKTQWVRVCVRPEQSFTRAILEIYMADGGTLGEVISALRKQKQFRIIQEISELAEVFLDVYNTYHKSNYSPTGNTNNHLYSILNTLFECFNKSGSQDPLNKFQLYSGGFKSYLASVGDGADKDLIVNSVEMNQSAPGSGDTQDSGYTSPHRYGGFLPSLSQTTDKTNTDLGDIKRLVSFQKCEEVEEKVRHRIRILLIFSSDGAGHAEQIVTGLENFSIQEYPTVQVDFFRLNELELWNSLLLNPEACLLKWLDEMDFVMPVLTPQFLQDLHSPSTGASPPAPTSPMINKYIYILLRSQYVSNGCQNQKVRPILPSEYVNQLFQCKPLISEPLFKMWREADLDTMRSRLGAIIKLWAKKHVL